MQIIKDKQITLDDWGYVEDDTPTCAGNITISLSRWQAEKETLCNHQGNLGIRLTSDQRVESIANDLGHFALVELEFPAFTDGRGFSQAWLLRNRFHYNGEIRAVGHFMRDQLFYLHRVGVNSFRLDNTNDLEGAIALLNDFSVRYQQSTY